MKLITFSSSTPDSVFDDWFGETHGGTDNDADVDEVLSDDYGDSSYEN